MTTVAADKKLIVLDLDETLIYSTESRLDRREDFVVGSYFVYTRPHLEEFVDYCFKEFDVGIWTTSTRDYAEEIVDRITKPDQTPRFIWARDRCTWFFDEETHERILVKKLEKLRKRGFKAGSIIAIDDTPSAWMSSYGNLVRVERFEGDATDDELHRLTTYLGSIKNMSNVRAVEKRNWRSKVLG